MTTNFPPTDSLVAPHITDLGVLSPRQTSPEHPRDNRLQLPAAGTWWILTASQTPLARPWNGIVGQIELRSTPLVWIEDVQVFPNRPAPDLPREIKIGQRHGPSRERPDRNRRSFPPARRRNGRRTCQVGRFLARQRQFG